MKKYIILFILFATNLYGIAQEIETDIFGDLIFESKNGSYKASLKENVFDDLIFSDNNDNEITLKNKYIKLEYPALLNDKEQKKDLFLSMIHHHRRDRNYKVTYSVDIFEKIIIEDNRQWKVEIGKDIFGNKTYHEENNGEVISMGKSLNGSWQYKGINKEATLEKDISDYWIYSDSLGNKFKFSMETWGGLINRFETEESVFNYLIDNFLFLKENHPRLY